MNWSVFQTNQKLIIAYSAYIVMLINGIFFSSPLIGIIAFGLFIITIGLWIGKLYGGQKDSINFLIGCFIFLSLTVVVVGTVIYFWVFSALAVWLFLGALPFCCLLIEKFCTSRVFKHQSQDFFWFSLTLRFKDKATAKFLLLIIMVFLTLFIACLGRTGDGISHIGETVSYIFWPFLGFSFFMLFLVWREKNIAIGLKLISTFLVAFMVFGAPTVVYRHYVTEDSFGLLGDIKHIIDTGIYCWVPNLARSGYFAITSLVVIGSSTQFYVAEVYKLLSPSIVSVYTLLFTYMLLERLTFKKQGFVALLSILIFPNMLFLSIPLEKNVATVFFLGAFFLSMILLENVHIRKSEIALLILILLAMPFLHNYFGMFAVIPLFLALYLRKANLSKKRFSTLIIVTVCLVGLIIPSSFVLGSLFYDKPNSVAFMVPQLENVLRFIAPEVKLPSPLVIENLPYFYSYNFIWVRYVFLLFYVLFIRRSMFLHRRPKTQIWLITTLLAFWIGYFFLKTFVQNPPEEAKDYRFGLFIDLAFVPLVGTAIIDVLERLKNLKLQIKLPKFKISVVCGHLLSLLVLIFCIATAVIPVYAGFNFDRIMERPEDAIGIGRYVVTDEKLQVMQYIQNITRNRISFVLSDAHMGQIAQGYLNISFEKAELFRLNSGGALYSYFNAMRRQPNLGVILELMKKTNSEVGFFVIGLNDWRGWQPPTAYWIDVSAIETLKSISDEWKTFGEENDIYVFVFEKK